MSLAGVVITVAGMLPQAASAAPVDDVRASSTDGTEAVLASHGLLAPDLSGSSARAAAGEGYSPGDEPYVDNQTGLTIPRDIGTLSVVAAGELPAVERGGWTEYNAESYTIAATTRESGVANALYAIIDSENAPTSFRFDVNVNGQPALLEKDGDRVLVRDSQGSLMNSIAPAWAVDAQGVAVPTRYEIDGSSLVQIVEHKGAAYPVVADPAAECDALSCTLWFNKSETKTASEGAFAATGILCGGAALLHAAAGFACGAYGVVVSLTAIQAKNQGDCLAFRTSNYGLHSPFPFIYNDSRCY